MGNSTESRWTTFQYFQYSFDFIQVALYVLSFLGNLLTLTAVIKFDNLHRKPTNMLIFSLAVADSLLGLLLRVEVMSFIFFLSFIEMLKYF